MLSGNAVKTLRCPFDALHDPLRLTTLSGNGAQIQLGTWEGTAISQVKECRLLEYISLCTILFASALLNRVVVLFFMDSNE
jgi:hypothetical protein